MLEVRVVVTCEEGGGHDWNRPKKGCRGTWDDLVLIWVVMTQVGPILENIIQMHFPGCICQQWVYFTDIELNGRATDSKRMF